MFHGGQTGKHLIHRCYAMQLVAPEPAKPSLNQSNQVQCTSRQTVQMQSVAAMNFRAFSSQFSTQRFPFILNRANITCAPSRRPVPGVRRQKRPCQAILASASAAVSAAAPAAVGLPQAYGYVWCVKRFNLHTAHNLISEMPAGTDL